MADVLSTGPVTQDLSIYQGDRYELFFRVYSLVWNQTLNRYVKDDYITLTGTPKATIKLKRGVAEAIVATFTCTLSDQNTTKGGVLCVLVPLESEKLVDSSYVYDVQISTDATHITTYLTGAVTVIKQVTSGA